MYRSGQGRSVKPLKSRKRLRPVPGRNHPDKIAITHDLDEVMNDVAAVILAVPSSTMRQNISLIASRLEKSTIIISASKGLEVAATTHVRVIAEEISPKFHANICALSGPQLAKEIIHNHPAASVVAAADKKNRQ